MKKKEVDLEKIHRKLDEQQKRIRGDMDILCWFIIFILSATIIYVFVNNPSYRHKSIPNPYEMEIYSIDHYRGTSKYVLTPKYYHSFRYDNFEVDLNEFEIEYQDCIITRFIKNERTY